MNLDSATVLIVEDEPLLLNFYSVWFKREGSNVLLARDGTEGLQLAEQNHVDLIISDIRMPLMDGIEMARHLNVRGASMPPILFVSGYVDRADRELYHIGMAKRLQKPTRRQDLITAARHSLLAKEERWSAPLEQEEGMVEVVKQACETADTTLQVTFGRGGLCLGTEARLLPRSLVRLDLTSEMETPAALVAIVRWIDPEQRLTGLEIRHVDSIGRAAVIRETDGSGIAAFIPRELAQILSTQPQQSR